MKELIGTNCNISLVVQEDGKLLPMVEAIMIVTEPQWGIDGGGELCRTRMPGTVRFSATPQALRALGKGCMKWADEADGALGKAEGTSAGGGEDDS